MPYFYFNCRWNALTKIKFCFYNPSWVYCTGNSVLIFEIKILSFFGGVYFFFLYCCKKILCLRVCWENEMIELEIWRKMTFLSFKINVSLRQIWYISCVQSCISSVVIDKKNLMVYFVNLVSETGYTFAICDYLLYIVHMWKLVPTEHKLAL